MKLEDCYVYDTGSLLIYEYFEEEESDPFCMNPIIYQDKYIRIKRI